MNQENSTSESMELTINGVPRSLSIGTSVRDLLELLQVPLSHVAVELNFEVVPPDAFAAVILRPADEVEIVTLMGGG